MQALARVINIDRVGCDETLLWTYFGTYLHKIK